MDYTKAIMSASIGVLMAAVSVLGYDTCQERKKDTINTKGNYFAVHPADFSNIYHSSVKIEKDFILEEKCKDSYFLGTQGSGVFLMDFQTGDNYILTAEHMTPDQKYSCEENRIKRKINVLESSLSVSGFPAIVVKEDEKADLALLKLEGFIDDALPYQGRIGSNLEIGDYVMGVGFPDGEKKYFIANVTNRKRNYTTVNVEIIGGNSGGGTYKLQDNMLELIGIVITTESITSLEKLRELFKDTPLEDDYL